MPYKDIETKRSYQREWTKSKRRKAGILARPSKKKSAAEYSRIAWSKRRKVLDELKSPPCMDCGKSFPPECMDFDHRDPAIKIANVGKLVKTNKWSDVVEEIEKCDLVCANCHRIRTRKRYLGLL